MLRKPALETPAKFGKVGAEAKAEEGTTHAGNSCPAIDAPPVKDQVFGHPEVAAAAEIYIDGDGRQAFVMSLPPIFTKKHSTSEEAFMIVQISIFRKILIFCGHDGHVEPTYCLATGHRAFFLNSANSAAECLQHAPANMSPGYGHRLPSAADDADLPLRSMLLNGKPGRRQLVRAKSPPHETSSTAGLEATIGESVQANPATSRLPSESATTLYGPAARDAQAAPLAMVQMSDWGNPFDPAADGHNLGGTGPPGQDGEPGCDTTADQSVCGLSMECFSDKTFQSTSFAVGYDYILAGFMCVSD